MIHDVMSPETPYSASTATPPSPDWSGLLPVALQAKASIAASIQEFWGQTMPTQLFSIASTPHYFWHMQDFYVAQKGLDDTGERWAQIRLSEGLCRFWFERVLGKNLDEPDFTLEKIRNFEVYLLERFSRKLFQELSPRLLKKPSRNAPDPQDDPLVHLVWNLRGEADQLCQIVLSAPQSCLKTRLEESDGSPPALPLRWVVPDPVFYDVHAPVVLQIGTTPARLEDLQRLEPDDLILFENSRLDQWHLRHPADPAQWLPVPIHLPDPHPARLSHYMQQGLHAMTDTTTATAKPNLWDNLEVEVTAAFNPVKLPLKQVKEMEQGLVLEIGDLMDNRVSVEVEGHPVAWGELLVLGDKFAVRIQGLHEAATETPQPERKPENTGTPEPPTNQASAGPQPGDPAANNDDAEDLMNFDLDESDFDDLDGDDDEDWT